VYVVVVLLWYYCWNTWQSSFNTKDVIKNLKSNQEIKHNFFSSSGWQLFTCNDKSENFSPTTTWKYILPCVSVWQRVTSNVTLFCINSCFLCIFSTELTFFLWCLILISDKTESNRKRFKDVKQCTTVQCILIAFERAVK